MSVDTDSIKKIAIKGEGSSYTTKDVGSEPENINIYRRADGTSVPSTDSNIDTEKTRTLDETLNDLGGGAYVGTRTAWESMTPTQKAKYDYRKDATVNFTDEQDQYESIIGENSIAAVSPNSDGTITGTIGNTSVASIGDGTISGAISSLNSSLMTKSSIKRGEVSGTTDAYGNLVTNLIPSLTILSARSATTALDGGAIPMISPNSDVWYFHCITNANQIFANKPVIIYYYYLD